MAVLVRNHDFSLLSELKLRSLVAFVAGMTNINLQPLIFPSKSVEDSPLIYNKPFRLGGFATDHSLTKVASRPLFVRVRRYAPQ